MCEVHIKGYVAHRGSPTSPTLLCCGTCMLRALSLGLPGGRALTAAPGSTPAII